VVAAVLLDPNALTIGCSPLHRLQAPELIFHDPERLMHPDRGAQPVQVVFAGKAHPADEPENTTCSRFTGGPSIRFSADAWHSSTITICMSRIFWSGCDVWLNNPRKPLSVRHERDESLDQRCPASEHRGRVVG
jgi:glucan phosphorylase